jgi:hypothetical protein
VNKIKLQRDIPELASVDVCVIGGGPAGTAAAVAARRCGRSVILLERTAQLGGMATTGSVAIWMSVGTVTGFYKEICQDLELSDFLGRDWTTIPIFVPLFNPFRLRHYLNRKLEDAGATVHFHMEFVAAMKEGGTLTHVVVMTREGLRAVRARQFIDCTGNASVAIDAGVPTRSGRDEDGATQSMTLMFMMQDTGRTITPFLPKGCPGYDRVEDLPQGRRLYWEDKATGTLLVNMTRVRGNGAKIEDASRCEREAIAQVFGVVHFLQRNGFPTYVLAHVAAQTGIRETNQIVGRVTLSQEDLVVARRFPDVATQNNYEIDIHNPTGKGGCDERKVGLYDIPLRCLIPMSGADNLLVAGRCLSASHVAMSSARVMPVCFGMGQAAGVAAALAVEQGVGYVEDIDISVFHGRLRKQGVEFYGL